MRSLCTDRLTSALRLIYSYGSYGMREILDDRPPIFDYLLSAHLIEAVHSDPNRPDKLYWVLTDAGKDELKRIDNRAKRHIALVGFFSLGFTPLCHRLCSFFDCPYPLFDRIVNTVFIATQLSLYCLWELIDAYLQDYNKSGSHKYRILTGLLILIIFFANVILSAGPFS